MNNNPGWIADQSHRNRRLPLTQGEKAVRAVLWAGVFSFFLGLVFGLLLGQS